MGSCCSSQPTAVYSIQTSPPSIPASPAAAKPAAAANSQNKQAWTTSNPSAAEANSKASAVNEKSRAEQFDEPTRDENLIEAASRNSQQLNAMNELEETPTRPKAINALNITDEPAAPSPVHLAAPHSPSANSSRPRGSLVLSSKASADEVLVTIPFFEELDRKNLKLLRAAFVHKTFESGEIIGEQGSDQAGFHVVISGSVELSIKSDTEISPFSPSLTIPSDHDDRPVLNDFGELVLAHLNSGSYFGSESLVEQSIQTVNVRALERTMLMSISREKFNEFVKAAPAMATSILDTTSPSKTRVTLKSLPFFSHVDEYKLQQLATLFEFKRFKKGDKIVTEGEVGDCFYILLSGSATVSVISPDTNQPQILDHLKENDFFGEIALIAHVPRTASVISDSDSVLCLFLSSDRFHQFSACAPEVFDISFTQIQNHRTSKLLKGIHLFDVLCQEELQESHEMMEFAKKNAPAPKSGKFRFRTLKTQEKSTEEKPAVDIGNRKFDEHRLGLLAHLFGFVSFDSGQVIFREGDRADRLYIIMKGAVEVSVAVESGNAVLNNLKAGQYFGEIGLFSTQSLDSPSLRSATVTATAPTTCLFLTADKFKRFLIIVPELRSQMEFAVGPRIAAIIENIPFFRHTVKENRPWSKLAILGELCVFEKREEGEIIMRQGEMGSKLFIIVAGQVEVKREIVVGDNNQSSSVAAAASADSAEASESSTAESSPAAPQSDGLKKLVINSLSEAPTLISSPSNQTADGPKKKVLSTILKRGRYFGQEALLNSPIRLATVTAKSLSVFLTLSRENFEKFLSISPEIKELMIFRQQTNYMETLERELLAQAQTHVNDQPDSPVNKKKKNKNAFARSYTIAAKPLTTASVTETVKETPVAESPAPSPSPPAKIEPVVAETVKSPLISLPPIDRKEVLPPIDRLHSNPTGRQSHDTMKLPPMIRAVSALPVSHNSDKERLQQLERTEKLDQQLQLLSAELLPSKNNSM